MIVVLLSYKVPIETVDAVRPAHIAWLRQGIADGRLLMAGRKVPVTGGMLIVRGSLAEAEAWCAEDPFATQGVADYQFVEVAPSLTAPGLEALAE